MQRLMDEEIDRWRPGDTVAVLPIAQNVTIEVILQAVLGVADVGHAPAVSPAHRRPPLLPARGAASAPSRRFAPRIAPPQRVREAAAFAAALPTPAVMTYFPELKGRSRWNVATRRWWRHRDRLFALLDEQIAATRADPRLAERDDILAMLVQARDEDGERADHRGSARRSLALIGAGHETTAAAIAWGAVLLAHNPDVRERATVAARENDEQYLGALVKEVLRIRPPIPVAAGRVLDEPFAIGPHTHPGGNADPDRRLGRPPRPRGLSRPRALPAGALPGRRARALHLAAVRRRRAPLHRLSARRARDQDRPHHDSRQSRHRPRRRRARAAGAARGSRWSRTPADGSQPLRIRPAAAVPGRSRLIATYCFVARGPIPQA